MMNNKIVRPLAISSLFALGASLSVLPSVSAQDKDVLELTDVMQFKHIEHSVLTDNGQWLAYHAAPDLGDPIGVVRATDGDLVREVARGYQPDLTQNGTWAVFLRNKSVLEQQQLTEDERKKLKPEAVLLHVEAGKEHVFADVEKAQFTGDGRALVLSLAKADEEDKTYRVEVVQLSEGADELENQQFERVSSISVAERGSRVALLQHVETESEDEKDSEPKQTLRVVNTSNQGQLVLSDNQHDIPAYAFDEAGERLAFVHQLDEESDYIAKLWTYGNNTPNALDIEREGFEFNKHSRLRFSEDNERLFLGQQLITEKSPEDIGKPTTESELYDLDRLAQDRDLWVWHGEDARIKPHESETLDERDKDVFWGVYHLADERFVGASSERVEQLVWSENPEAMLGYDQDPYLRSITWNGFFRDLYHVDLNTGELSLIANQVGWGNQAELSPDGRFVAWYQNGQLWLYDTKEEVRRQVATDVIVSWADELHDTPDAPAGYGIAGWLDDGSAFLAYDRYDVWRVNMDGTVRNLTQDGRENRHVYRLLSLPEGELGYASDKPLPLSRFDENDKTTAFAQVSPQGDVGAQEVLANDATNIRFRQWSKDASRWLFTQEDFATYPNLWVTSEFSAESLQNAQQITDLNPQIDNFKWGSTELISWSSARGDALEGVVIKPDDYDPDRRYPVLVYYYEKFAQRLNDFNDMRVNHRPNFPFYASNDYVIFLPDIHFDLQEPGRSATDSLVPGVQKLIDDGIADPDAIGLHGHSWSGYQSVHVITQTDIFAAAVAGAPVVNMTSAYNGIRWGSGLARQFQYEMGQSRIGDALHENLPVYIENSPVFFAERINTPLVIQFGDKDDAVPWEQGIEMYLAMRRLDKPVVMLHYQNEPHHLKKFANKVDYSQKMKAFFDHYLKGAPAPVWWSEGEALTK